ncbi:MAG: hypothetical protein F6K58_22580 [Symploca sp. SIO2E9]|nr:hypothetical protein [Symploca sp. SIO2E9]NEP01389.1 hypothetical protein [Symploca sp. SIO2E9]
MGNSEKFGNVTNANAEFLVRLEAVKESSHSRGERGRWGERETRRRGDAGTRRIDKMSFRVYP